MARRLSRRRVAASFGVVVAAAAGTAALGALLDVPEAAPRHSPGRHPPLVASRDGARSAPRAVVSLCPTLAVAPVLSVAAVSAAVSGAPAERGATLAERAARAAEAFAVRARSAPPVVAVATIDTASWVRSAALDANAPTTPRTLVVIGRVDVSSEHGDGPFAGALVTLATVLDEGGPRVEDEDLRVLLASVAPERRGEVDDALGSTPRRMVVDIATAPSGPDGKFRFVLDATRLSSSRYLVASARAHVGGQPFAALACRQSIPAFDPEGETPGVVSFSSLTLKCVFRASVRVTAGGAPLPFARVLVRGAESDSFVAVADGAGRVAAETIGKACFQVQVEGLSNEERAPEDGDADAQIALDLVSEETLAVVVRDPAGAPVSDASVGAWSDGNGSSGDTDEDGRVTLRGLAAGRTYSVCASVRGRPLGAGSIEVTLPAKEQVVTLVPAGALDVTLALDATVSGRTARGGFRVFLECRDPETGEWRSSDEASTSEGAVSFAPLADGTYRVRARSDDNDAHLALAFSPSLEVVAGRATRTSLMLGTGRPVTAWLTDTCGNPFPSSPKVEETGEPVNIGSNGWLELRLLGTPIHLVFESGGEKRTVLVRPDAGHMGEIALSR